MANSDVDSTAATTTTTKQYIHTEELHKIFNRFDANGDGLISLTELGAVMKSMGSSYSQEELQRVIDDIDTDKDGFINLSEFASIVGSGTDSSSADAQAELRDAFDLYDQDKNGLISAQELHSVMCRIKMTCTVEDCVKMIQSVDADGDGNVSFDEFVKMMSHPIHMGCDDL